MHAVAFTTDATRLITAAADATARIYDTTTGTELRKLTHDGPVTALAIDPTNTTLATASTDTTARIYPLPA